MKFQPYMEDSYTAVVELLDYPSADTRRAAVSSVSMLCRAVWKLPNCKLCCLITTTITVVLWPILRPWPSLGTWSYNDVRFAGQLFWLWSFKFLEVWVFKTENAAASVFELHISYTFWCCLFHIAYFADELSHPNQEKTLFPIDSLPKMSVLS